MKSVQSHSHKKIVLRVLYCLVILVFGSGGGNKVNGSYSKQTYFYVGDCVSAPEIARNSVVGARRTENWGEILVSTQFLWPQET